MKNYKYLILGAIPFLLVSCNATQTKSYSVSAYKTTLEFHDDFKIMQLTDMHFSIQSDFVKNRDYVVNNVRNCNPDLIVLTGDSFMDATPNIVMNVLDFINDLSIPFAFTYGNHDHQGSYGYYFVNDYLKTLSNSVFVDYDDDDIFGSTNYFVDLVKKDEIKYRLYIIDSNSYVFNNFKYSYDIIHEDQIKHIENIVKEDGAVPGLAFYHIPLYETDDAYKLYKDSDDRSIIRGEHQEKVSVGYKRTDAFDRMTSAGIIGHFYGHDHINNTDIMYKGVSLSYGIKSTYEIYSDDALLGYKMVTLKDDMSYSLDNITSEVVAYEK